MRMYVIYYAKKYFKALEFFSNHSKPNFGFCRCSKIRNRVKILKYKRNFDIYVRYILTLPITLLRNILKL